MDIMLSKNEQIERLERKIRSLEQKMEYKLSNVDSSLEMLKNSLIQLQNENKELKNDRDFLLGKYKDTLRRIEKSEILGAKFISPIKTEIRENANLIRDIALEGFGADTGKSGIDSLFELVMNKKKLTAEKAAKELGVDEKKVKYWALKLENQGLIKTQGTLGKTLLLKK